MSVDVRTKAVQKRRALTEAIVGYAAFCAISLLSQVVPLALPLMVISGLTLPLAWGKRTGDWERMGFTRRNPGAAILWGSGAGVATSLIGFVTVPERSLPADLGLELAVGVPLWLLVASPFQEFFFRGWLQPRFENKIGKGLGLLVTTAGFTAWHYAWPLAAQSSVPLYTLRGLVATFGAGLIYGYSFQRTGSVVAPWLAHGCAGITFVIIGAGSFVGAAG
jgi:membrane protease YdiL (CAAX protease family)